MVLKSAKLRLHLLASRTHKWLAIIIGAQLLLWFASGALMSFLPIDRVHGDHLVDRKAAAPLPRGSTFAPPSAIVGAADAPIEAITYRMWLGRPVAEVATAKGTRLFDAATGQALPAPTAREAEEIARLAWRGGARPAAKVERIERASPEYRGTLPAWRVAFADLDSTRVFSRPTPVGSRLSEPALGGSTTSSGAFTSWIGRITRTSTRPGCSPSRSVGLRFG